MSFSLKMAGKFDYTHVKNLIEAKKINGFKTIFDFYGIRTALAEDTGIYYTRFKIIINQCDLFTGREIYQMARVLGVEEEILLQLWFEQMEKDKTKIKKRK